MQPLLVEVTDASQIGEARRQATILTRALDFDETQGGRAALVITEAATNLVKHAGGGQVWMSPSRTLDQDCLDVLAMDKGPGMADLERCFRDGYSTAGSPGTGLGAIARLADEVDIYTAPEAGTVLFARIGKQPRERKQTPAADPSHLGVVQLAMRGEPVCGDGWAVARTAERTILLLVDGLGHGPIAAEAAREAIRIFRENARLSPVEIVQASHDALRSTRGAAAVLSEIDCRAQTLRYAGIGNISGAIFSEGVSRNLVSQNGTLGHQMRKVQEFTYPFPAGALLILHSDGLTTHWRLDQYAGLAARSLMLITGVLFRDFCRGRDDVTILAFREPGKDAA